MVTWNIEVKIYDTFNLVLFVFWGDLVFLKYEEKTYQNPIYLAITLTSVNMYVP